MNKDEVNKTIQNWLINNQPEGKKLVFACSSAGILIATKQETGWQTDWADHMVIYSDIINQYPIKIPKLVTLPASTSTNMLTCHCGRTFTKRFALTNHQKICKQVPSEVIPKPVDEIMDETIAIELEENAPA